MKLDYFIVYAEANIVCIIIFILLLIHDGRYGIRQEKQIWFNRTVIAHILYFISDIFWAAILGGELPHSRSLVVLFNFLNFVLLSLMSFEWLGYVAASENILARFDRRKRRLALLPMAVSTCVIVVLYIISPAFWVSEAGDLNPLYYPLMLASPLIYIISSFVISMVKAKKTDSRDDRRLFIIIGVYPLTVVFFGILQLSLLNAPLFCFGCTLMMLFFYLQATQTLISVDPLTRLNNRGQITRQLRQIRYRENRRCYAAMIDVDHFKQINDTYGHAEGDHALILVAESLKQTAEQLRANAFIGRYGGDEFTMIVQAGEGEESMEEIISLLRNLLREKKEKTELPYEMKISVGYDMLKDANDTLEACLNRADEKLYQDKHSRR